jgi:hypothetical protein
MKKFVALARVSSREQEREGFSLDVQEDALRAYAQRHDGSITKLYRIAKRLLDGMNVKPSVNSLPTPRNMPRKLTVYSFTK